MNRLEAISVWLQPKEIEILLKYHERAKKEYTQHFFWEKIETDLKEDYPVLMSLRALGFVQLEKEKDSIGTVYESYYLTLYPSAIHRSEFENFSKVKKWLVRNRLKYKDWMAVLGFALSIALAIIRLIEFISQ
jgi:hypothetical protein